MDPTHTKDVWKCSIITNGGRYATTYGISMEQTYYANPSDIHPLKLITAAPITVKEPVLSYWTTLIVLVAKHALGSARWESLWFITVDIPKTLEPNVCRMFD